MYVGSPLVHICLYQACPLCTYASVMLIPCVYMPLSGSPLVHMPMSGLPHSSFLAEASLSGSGSSMDSAILNGLEDLNLCSSRRRSKRDSLIKRDSMTEETSPKHSRRSTGEHKTSPLLSRRGIGEVEEDTSPKHSGRSMAEENKLVVGTGRSPSENRRSAEPKVAADSLLDMLRSGDLGLEDDAELESSIQASQSPTHIKRPVRGSDSSSTPTRKISLESGEHEVVLRRKTSRDSDTPSSSSAPAQAARERGGGKGLKRDTPIIQEDETEFRMRGRSNAIDVHSSHNYRTAAQKSRDEAKESPLPETKEEKEEPAPAKKKELHHMSSLGVDDATSHRVSDSWKNKRHLSGDQALGIFYHNRRSQMFDTGDLDEAERGLMEDKRGSSLERSDSSGPHSPTTLRARDSCSFSPIPSSPLVSKRCSFDKVGLVDVFVPGSQELLSAAVFSGCTDDAFA